MVLTKASARRRSEKDGQLGAPILEEELTSGNPIRLSACAWLSWKLERIRSERRGVHSIVNPVATSDARGAGLRAVAENREVEVAKCAANCFQPAILTVSPR